MYFLYIGYVVMVFRVGVHGIVFTHVWRHVCMRAFVRACVAHRNIIIIRVKPTSGLPKRGGGF
jgi:hypothetical protein